MEREARSTEPLTSQKKHLAEEGTSATSAVSGAPPHVAGLARRNLALQDSQSHSPVSSLMETYKNAYEARDLDALGHVWNMDPAWRDATTRLFTNSRQIAVSLALDEENMTESADQRQVSAPFSQTVTTINQDGQVSTHGPFFCIADLRKQSANIWRIQELQEDPQHPGQCRLQP